MASSIAFLLFLGILASTVLQVYAGCAADEFRCINFDYNICVSNSTVRDGKTDCPDNSDEVPTPCGPTGVNISFVCDGTCSQLKFRFDNVAQCADIADEVKFLGDFCSVSHTNYPCTRWTNDSTCVSNVCVCQTGWREIDFKTCQIRVLGDPCAVTVDCSAVITHSECKTGTCQCVDGAYEGSGNCILRKIGDNCTVTLDCSAAVTNSQCSATTTPSMCLCNSGHVANTARDTCTLRKVGDACSTNPDCTVAIGLLSSCSAGVCVCPAGHKGVTSCSPRIFGDTCAIDTHCSTVPNAVCSGGRCACSPGHVVNTAMTVCTRRTVGSSCTTDSQCTAVISNSTCVNQTCHCIPNHVSILSGTQCRELNPGIKIGDICFDNVECNHVITNSVCSGGKCACINLYYPPSSTQCIPGCATDAACQSLITNSKCINFACNCEAGTRRVTSINTCEKNNLRDACSQSFDCALIGNAVCQGGVCACRVGAYVDGAQCKLRIIGDPCTTGPDCSTVIPGSNCTAQGKCECVIGYRTFADSCSKYKLGDNCTNSIDCATSVSGTGCVGGKCQCLSMYDTDKLGQCIPKKLFSNCSLTSDCPGANLQCLNGVCACKQGYQPDAINATCYIVRIGDNCTGSSECTKFVENSICAAKGNCVCAVNYEPAGASCKSKQPDCDFFCQYPWVIPVALVVGVILTIVGVIILYVVCKIKKRKSVKPVTPDEKSEDHAAYAIENERPPTPKPTLTEADETTDPVDDIREEDINSAEYILDPGVLKPQGESSSI